MSNGLVLLGVLEEMFAAAPDSGVHVDAEMCRMMGDVLQELRVEYVSLSIEAAAVSEPGKIVRLERLGAPGASSVTALPPRREFLHFQGRVTPIPIRTERFDSSPTGGAA